MFLPSAVTTLHDLSVELAALDTQHARRVRHIVESAQGAHLVVDGRELLHFGSNDYLGLANDPRVRAAAKRAIDAYGVGAGASHLISGHFAPHELLERELAEFAGGFCTDARALLFSTGYMANLGIVTALVGRGDAVFADKLNHACLNDAALLSRAEFVRYPHGDIDALAQQLAASKAKRKLIASDGVFSMDGDLAPLENLLALAEEHDAWLLVDDAHGFGVLGEGRGSVAHLLGSSPARPQEAQSDRLIYMGTLGKAAGVAGAFVCAPETVIEWLLQKARTYIFTTASPPAFAEALRASLAIMRDEPERRTHLAALIGRLRDRLRGLPWTLFDSMTPIQPLIIGDNEATLAVSRALWERGIWVPAIRPPTVPAGTSRLRVTLSAAHTAGDVDLLVSALRDIVESVATGRRGGGEKIEKHHPL
jgi:8-amino-7-oxononanoate synthase